MEFKSIELELLVAHEGNPNRMSKEKFKKLVGHIRRTGLYEPIVVRVHPRMEGRYEIINGHHRREALAEIGVGEAQCVVWEASDEQVDVFLTTLNRLGGCDDIVKRAAIIERLAGSIDVKQLSRMLPESAKQLERLKELPGARCQVQVVGQIGMPAAVVFILSGEQKEVVEKAMVKAGVKRGAKERAEGIVKIAEAFLGCGL